jgi:hypothetical protein
MSATGVCAIFSACPGHCAHVSINFGHRLAHTDFGRLMKDRIQVLQGAIDCLLIAHIALNKFRPPDSSVAANHYRGPAEPTNQVRALDGPAR